MTDAFKYHCWPQEDPSIHPLIHLFYMKAADFRDAAKWKRGQRE